MLGVYKYTSKTSPDVGIRPQNETKMESWERGQSSCVQMKLLLQHSASFPDHQLSFSLVSFPDQRSGYTLCPGIRSYEEEFAETIRFQSKNLRIWCHPAVRHDSNQCLLWHKPNKFQLQSTSLIGLIPRPSTELFRPFHCLQCAKFIMYFT